jgi:uncharacterized protein
VLTEPTPIVEQESSQRPDSPAQVDSAALFSNVVLDFDADQGILYATISDVGPYPTPRQLIEILQGKGIKYWIDEKTIHLELGKKILNQPIPVALAKHEQAEITIGEHERKAFLLLKPAQGGERLTLDDVEKAIADHGVVFGVDRNAVEKALLERQYHARVLVAEAKEPVQGTDAQLNLNFRTTFKIEPKDLEHHKVDFRELGLVATVTQGSVVAFKTPATPGEAGTTVTGKPIPAKPGKDLLLGAGKNTHLSDDRSTVIADRDGHPLLKGKTVSVEEVLTIPSDVDFSTGNIHFAGSLRVQGNVLAGFSVTATGSVEIDGFVEGAVIEAGGDILIKGGVQGRNTARVRAGGSVTMLFAEHAVIEAGKDISAGEVLHADLSAGDRIQIAMGKGQACGGRLRARSLIVAKLLGSELDVPTEAVVGYDPEAKKRLDAMRKEKVRLAECLAKAESGICTLEECLKEGALNERRRELYDRLLQAREQLAHQTEEAGTVVSELETIVGEAATPEIKVHDKTFPNVTICVKNARLLVKEEWEFATFYESNGEVRIMPYG